MINFFSVTAQIAALFWLLLGWITGIAGKRRISGWFKLRCMYCMYRSDYWDRGGLFWNWKKFKYLKRKYRKFGIKDPNDLQYYFYFDRNGRTEAFLAERLKLKPHQKLAFFEEALSDHLLYPVDHGSEVRWHLG